MTRVIVINWEQPTPDGTEWADWRGLTLGIWKARPRQNALPGAWLWIVYDNRAHKGGGCDSRSEARAEAEAAARAWMAKGEVSTDA